MGDLAHKHFTTRMQFKAAVSGLSVQGKLRACSFKLPEHHPNSLRFSPIRHASHYLCFSKSFLLADATAMVASRVYVHVTACVWLPSNQGMFTHSLALPIDQQLFFYVRSSVRSSDK